MTATDTATAGRFGLESTYSATARHYDGVYSAKVLEDIPFYLELAAQSEGPILELAAGTGRVTIPLARAGHTITALDINPAMLSQLEAKLQLEPEEVRARVNLVQGDMVDFRLGQRFGLILMPFRGFQHLIEAERQRACLKRVADHLSAGGRYVFNAYNPNFEFMVRKAGLGGAFVPDLEYVDASGNTVRRFNSIVPDFPTQSSTVLFRYETVSPEGRLLGTEIDRIYMRWQTRWEAQYLLELCGFAIEAAYGGFDKRALDERGTELIYVCRRAG